MSETFDKFDPKDWSDYLDPTSPFTQLANYCGITNPVDVVSFGLGYDEGYCEDYGRGYGLGATEINTDHHPSWLNEDAYDMGYDSGTYDGWQDS